MEPLEDRTVLSTLFVTTTADTIDANPNVTSLREAIQAANDVINYPDADVIQFAAGVLGTITLDSALGQLGITDDLTITGPGAHRLAVSGNDAVRVFYVAPAVTGTEITVSADVSVATMDSITAGHGSDRCPRK
jgi:CSLREA domain-containing protein